MQRTELDWLPDHEREHMRDWLRRYAPGTPEQIEDIDDQDLILGFIAYHRVDNE